MSVLEHGTDAQAPRGRPNWRRSASSRTVRAS